MIKNVCNVVVVEKSNKKEKRQCECDQWLEERVREDE